MGMPFGISHGIGHLWRSWINPGECSSVQVDQVSKLETNSNENGKLKNDWELRMRNFCASIHFKLNGVAQGWSRGTVQAALISSCEALELHSRMKEKLCARLRPSSPFLSFLCFYGSSGGPTSEAIAASTASILTEFIQTKMDGQASRSGMDHSKDTHDQRTLETHSISNSIVHLDCLYFYVVVHSRQNWQFLRHKNWG